MNFFKDYGAQFLANPIPFIVLFLLTVVGTFGIAHLFYSERIETVKDRAELAQRQRDDYKEKLSGATPDEARARLDRLEATVASMMPRKLSPDQTRAMSGAIGNVAGTILITNDMASADATGYAAHLSNFFKSVGWKVSNGAFLGSSFHPKTGLSLSLKDPSNPSPAEAGVLRALAAAGIAFDAKSSPPMAPPNGGPPDVEIAITSPL
ncbi:hypothetical protein [Rhodopseudomonas sp. AAP120]|uniref:hypothetical protein n=1 Tax=Rhodopseudomonas sp. AAP120 TaxID=1523430 RepID=UPI000AE3C107|nr:hypothetical protein [Rhodopseudomonas sp. AAP120]